MYFDGSVMKTGAGAGLLFISPLGDHMRYVIRLHFPASNNMAEYEALLGGLRIAIELGFKRLDVVAKMASHAIFQYNVLAIDDIHNTWTNMIVKMTILRLLGSSDDKEKIGVARPKGTG